MMIDYHISRCLPKPNLLIMVATIASYTGRQDGISRGKVDHWAAVE